MASTPPTPSLHSNISGDYSSSDKEPTVKIRVSCISGYTFSDVEVCISDSIGHLKADLIKMEGAPLNKAAIQKAKFVFNEYIPENDNVKFKMVLDASGNPKIKNAAGHTVACQIIPSAK